MSRALLPAFIQDSADWAAVRKGQVNELRKTLAPVPLLLQACFPSLSWTGDLKNRGSCGSPKHELGPKTGRFLVERSSIGSSPRILFIRDQSVKLLVQSRQ